MQICKLLYLTCLNNLLTCNLRCVCILLNMSFSHALCYPRQMGVRGEAIEFICEMRCLPRQSANHSSAAWSSSSSSKLWGWCLTVWGTCSKTVASSAPTVKHVGREVIRNRDSQQQLPAAGEVRLYVIHLVSVIPWPLKRTEPNRTWPEPTLLYTYIHTCIHTYI